MTIANNTSRRIIISWFNKAMDPITFPGYDHFDRFISLWISFNGYFVSEHYQNAKKLQILRYGGGEPSEKMYLYVIGHKRFYNEIYSKILQESIPFNSNLVKFDELLKNTMFPGAIADLRPNRSSKQDAAYFTDKADFKQFLGILYQIRCNLFHGNKSPDSDSDKEIVKISFNLLLEFVKQVYEKNHLL